MIETMFMKINLEFEIVNNDIAKGHFVVDSFQFVGERFKLW